MDKTLIFRERTELDDKASIKLLLSDEAPIGFGAQQKARELIEAHPDMRVELENYVSVAGNKLVKRLLSKSTYTGGDRHAYSFPLSFRSSHVLRDSEDFVAVERLLCKLKTTYIRDRHVYILSPSSGPVLLELLDTMHRTNYLGRYDHTFFTNVDNFPIFVYLAGEMIVYDYDYIVEGLVESKYPSESIQCILPWDRYIRMHRFDGFEKFAFDYINELINVMFGMPTFHKFKRVLIEFNIIFDRMISSLIRQESVHEAMYVSLKSNVQEMFAEAIISSGESCEMFPRAKSVRHVLATMRMRHKQ